jgi:protoporphyrin/coproporphyrin ferrochelatase
VSGPERIAVVLFNLGGPDSPEAVKPFLFNLFSDAAIISAPQPFRWLIARLISSRRAPVAREIYAHIGGKSPIVPETERQAEALERVLGDTGDLGEVKCFIAMRYWHPFAGDAAAKVAAFNPDKIVLLPLYPQYSTATTASSLKDWAKAWANQVGLGPTSLKSLETKEICCYPEAKGWIEAQASLIKQGISQAGGSDNVRVLFSAHGLPKKIVDAGDPYQRQVERTCAAVVKDLQIQGLDWVTCYQSRVGPLEWIGPSTDEEIERAGRDGRKIVLVPIAFVSEHSETLVELDIEYGALAQKSGVETYIRVPAAGTHPAFIRELGDQVRAVLASDDIICPEELAGGTCPGNRP